MEKIACYIRVSTEEQKLHGISLDAQRDKLKEYADKNNLLIVGWYEDEGVSGRKLIRNRPALQRMLNDAQSGLFERIIFIKLDRFFRSVAEYHECMKYLGSVTWTATEEKYDLTTANGRAFVNMKLTIAELEADQTGERIKIVNDYKVKCGQAISGSLSIAFKLQDKKIIHNPEYEALVCDYISHFLIHQSKRGSLKYVKDKYGLPVSYRSITTLLKDTKLYGAYRDNLNYCEPYIDKETFNKIQAIAERHIKTPQNKRVYLFTGIIKCPLCGRYLSSNCSVVTNKSQRHEYYTYKCNNRYMNFNCDFNHSLRESKIESYLLNNFNRHINLYIDKVQITDLKKALDKESVNKKIAKVQHEMKNTTIAFTKGRLSESEYDKLYNDLEDKLKALNETLEPIKDKDLTPYQDIIKSGWLSIYNNLTKENKRAFWRKYIKEILIDKDANIIDLIFFD